MDPGGGRGGGVNGGGNVGICDADAEERDISRVPLPREHVHAAAGNQL